MIKKIRNDVEKLNQNEDFYQLFTDEEDLEYYGNGLYSEGMEQGITDEKYNIAHNMLNLHISIDNIVKATGLTKEQINALKN